MPIILSSPASVAGGHEPPAPKPPRPQTWQGVDGSIWPLVGPGAMPRLRQGVKGLHMPPMNVYKSSSPLVPGVDLTGYSLPERPVYWPLMFAAQDVADWQRRHAGFFDSFHPVQTGLWIVGEGNERRTLPLVGVFNGDYSFTRDPFVSGFAVIGIELEAPRPLWRGEVVEREFSNAAGSPFIPPGGGPPFTISASSTFSTAAIPNLGQEPAYLKWEAVGPLLDLQLGVDGAVIDVPFALSGGAVLQINTDPAEPFATLNGVDCTRELGFQLFAPVPALGTSPLIVVATGAGKVTASLTPLFWRAF